MVVDLQGRLVLQRHLSLLNRGYHEFEIYMKHASSGVYFYNFTINKQDYASQKMVLLK